MAYIVFDLDETLGKMYTPYYFLCDLKYEKQTRNQFPSVSRPPPPELVPILDDAYKKFVESVAATEKSDRPLGILRPGILAAFEKFAELKSRGLIKGCVIYSNNGHLPSLEFTRDVIEDAIGSPGLFCDCIHWYHPSRRPEYILDFRGKPKPGAARKTWGILSKILKEGPCGAPEDLQPSQVYFFDDLIHNDLRYYLKQNYNQVPEYRYKTPVQRLETAFRLALEESGLLSSEALTNSFLDYVYKICAGTRPESIEALLKSHRQNTAGTAPEDSLPPAPDDGAALMNALADKLLAQGNLNYQQSINTSLFQGGRFRRHRRRTLKKRRGSKKTKKSRSGSRR
jgi:hypothetical protein